MLLIYDRVASQTQTPCAVSRKFQCGRQLMNARLVRFLDAGGLEVCIDRMVDDRTAGVRAFHFEL